MEFTVVGEGLAVDLADTELLAVSPKLDLLATEEDNEKFWDLHAGQVPVGTSIPAAGATRRLRSAVRALLDARVRGEHPEPWAVEDVNAAAAAVPTSLRMDIAFSQEIRWHYDQGGNAALAAVARSAIELVTGPHASQLRRCAAEDCSMLFVATNSRRQWCTPNLCGNRARVARHAARSKHD